jgi:hypothetical protein
LKRLPVIAGSLFFWSSGMRALILIAGAALALGACNKNDQAGGASNADDGLAAENMATNDITAIDAVTGADANMAADVNYLPGVENDTAANASSNGDTAKPAHGGTAASASAAAPETTAQNTSAPAAATANNSL